MTLSVRDAAGNSVLLADEPFAQGGEAAIHTVLQHPNVVVKLYHPRILEKRADALQTKIEAMVTDPRLAHFKQHQSLAWPRLLVFDGQPGGQWRGYAMRRADGVRLNVLAHAMAYREHFPNLDRPAVVSYLLNLLAVVQHLHAAKVMIGDYNLANFLCNPASHAVTLIDCDSWQLDAAGKTFYCPVAAPDMLAPELHGKELGKTSRPIESELFSLAIVLFKALMLGRHPFDVVGGASPVENIRNGYFPYGKGGGGIPKGPWFNIWSHLSYSLKEQLIHTFREGSQTPSARTPVAHWIELLHVYRGEIHRGWHSSEIRPAEPKSKGYKGSQPASSPVVG